MNIQNYEENEGRRQADENLDLPLFNATNMELMRI